MKKAILYFGWIYICLYFFLF